MDTVRIITSVTKQLSEHMDMNCIFYFSVINKEMICVHVHDLLGFSLLFVVLHKVFTKQLISLSSGRSPGLCLSLALSVIFSLSLPAAALPYFHMSAVFAFDSMFKENEYFSRRRETKASIWSVYLSSSEEARAAWASCNRNTLILNLLVQFHFSESVQQIEAAAGLSALRSEGKSRAMIRLNKALIFQTDSAH